MEVHDAGTGRGGDKRLALLRTEQVHLGVAEELVAVLIDEGGRDVPFPRCGDGGEAVDQRDAVPAGHVRQGLPERGQRRRVKLRPQPEGRVPHREKLRGEEQPGAGRGSLAGGGIHRGAVGVNVQHGGVRLHQGQ